METSGDFSTNQCIDVDDFGSSPYWLRTRRRSRHILVWESSSESSEVSDEGAFREGGCCMYELQKWGRTTCGSRKKRLPIKGRWTMAENACEDVDETLIFIQDQLHHARVNEVRRMAHVVCEVSRDLEERHLFKQKHIQSGGVDVTPNMADVDERHLFEQKQIDQRPGLDDEVHKMQTDVVEISDGEEDEQYNALRKGPYISRALKHKLISCDERDRRIKKLQVDTKMVKLELEELLKRFQTMRQDPLIQNGLSLDATNHVSQNGQVRRPTTESGQIPSECIQPKKLQVGVEFNMDCSHSCTHEVEGSEKHLLENSEVLFQQGPYAAVTDDAYLPPDDETRSPAIDLVPSKTFEETRYGVRDSESKESKNNCTPHEDQADNTTEEQSSHMLEWGYSDKLGVNHLTVDDDVSESEDPMEVMWKEMGVSLACAKDSSTLRGEMMKEPGDEEECSHNFVVKNPVGHVCCNCGFIGNPIENIHEFYWNNVRKKRVESTMKEQDSSGLDGKSGFKWEEMHFSIPCKPAAALNVDPNLKSLLKNHQLQGFEFLVRNILDEEGGCALAHAPGTGKTFLTIVFLQSLLTNYPDRRVLILAPKSVLLPWVEEFKKWGVKEKVQVYNLYEANKAGEKNLEAETSQVDDVFRWRQYQMLNEWVKNTSILMMGYCQFSQLISDAEASKIKIEIKKMLLEIPDVLVLDEGHFPRTKDTRIFDALVQVKTKKRIVLSGTMFQNNFEELYNIFKLVKPDFMKKFPAYATTVCSKHNGMAKVDAYNENHQEHSTNMAELRLFQQQFGDRIEKGGREERIKSLQNFHNLIDPFVNWYKGEVLETLPGISVCTVFLKLLPGQLKALCSLKRPGKRNRLKSEKLTTGICIHPSLSKVDLDEESLVGRYGYSSPSEISQISSPYEGAKTMFIFDILDLCVLSKEKLLVFSRYLAPLFLLESMLCRLRGWQDGVDSLRLDGRMQPEERERIIKDFNDGKDSKVLFASIKACGEGISLVGASRVVFLDMPWNPAVTRQAVARAFRIGQKRKVYVYRLVAEIEAEKKIEEASSKKEWFSRVLFDPILISSDLPTNEELAGKFDDQFMKSHALTQHVVRLYKNKFL